MIRYLFYICTFCYYIILLVLQNIVHLKELLSGKALDAIDLRNETKDSNKR